MEDIVHVDRVNLDTRYGGFGCCRPVQLQTPVFPTFLVIGSSYIAVLICDLIGWSTGVPDTERPVFVCKKSLGARHPSNV